MPGPLLSAAAIKAAKHGSEYIESEMRQKRADRAAMTEAMSKDPDAAQHYASAEASKTKRTGIRVLALLTSVGIVCGSAAYVAYEGPKSVVNGLDKLWHDLQSGTPKPELSIAINSALNHVELPNRDVILAQADGTSSAEIITQEESSTPAVGGIYNFIFSPGTKRTATAKRDDSLQLTVKGSDISLQGYQVNTANNANGTPSKPVFGIEATVPVDAFGSQLVNPHNALTPKRTPIAKADSSWFNNSMQLLGEHDRTATYISSISQMADYNFLNSCENFVEPTIPAGVRHFVSELISENVQLEQTLGQTANAKLLQSLEKEPIKVNFVRTIDQNHGHTRTIDANASSINLPEMYVPNKDEIASMLNLSPNEVNLDNSTPPCTVTASGMQDILGLVTANK